MVRMFKECLTALLIYFSGFTAFCAGTGIEGSFIEQDQEDQICLGLLQTGQRANAVHKKPLALYHQELDNGNDTSYTGNITVGKQHLQAILDTGSFELLLFSKSCQTCGAAAERGFDSRLSQTFEQGALEQMMSFGSGDTYCRDAFDVLEIGPLSVKRQPLWEVIFAEMEILEAAEFQAILGLGPPAAVKSQAEDSIEALKAMEAKFKAAGAVVPARLQSRIQDQRKAAKMMESLDDSVPANLGTRYLSICLEQAHGAKGHIFWNDARPDKRPESFRRLAVTGEVTWGLDLRNVRLVKPDGNSYNVACQTGCSAILDSGTSLISAPSSSIRAMLQVLTDLGASCKQDDLPTLEFELGGELHVLPPDVYMGMVEGMMPAPWKKAYKQQPLVKVVDCELLMMDTGNMVSEQGPIWIMGMPFFRYFYSTFDYGFNMSDPAGKRSIWTAPADPKCNPLNSSEQHSNATGQALNHLPAGPRRVDQGRLRLPLWMANRDDDNVSL
eukprot:gb/GFBE01012512.1/.p1 GENE.gb/GFBE01012512.1/~~gb/GFBE01012512.1/.p1  ORF type:complete len:499 (+),score=95.56 gb/GFBE01012512.1/:1-1497(+)